jgi:myo-inositol-1(or 4)-monophosphatase
VTRLGVPPLAAAAAAPAGPDVVGEPRWAAAVWLARLGGQLALEGFAHARITWKGDDSMVTDVDLRIQERLTAEIARAFPGDLVVGEEGVSPGVAALHDHVWAIDPIDGTNNFGRGLPGFAVSIGVLAAGIPIAGAVYDPVADQLFTARGGQGAWLGHRRLAVAPAPLGPRSLVSVRTPYPGGIPAAVLDWLTRYRLRRTGSTALQLCYVAMGALAFVHDHKASIWDVAGAAPVLLEAGGRFTAPDGKGLFPVGASTLAGAPLAFVAGDPIAHARALDDLAAAHPDAVNHRPATD